MKTYTQKQNKKRKELLKIAILFAMHFFDFSFYFFTFLFTCKKNAGSKKVRESREENRKKRKSVERVQCASQKNVFEFSIAIFVFSNKNKSQIMVKWCSNCHKIISINCVYPVLTPQSSLIKAAQQNIELKIPN